MPSTGSRSRRARDRPDRAAVRERLVHGEVEPVVAPLHLGPVERARPALDGEPPAGRALPGLVRRRLPGRAAARRARRRRLERLRPSPRRRGRCGPPPRASARPPRSPARARQRSSSGSTTSSSSGGAACASALVQPTTALCTSLREQLLELRPHLLGRDDDHLRPAQAAHLPVELLGDLLQVLVDELLDVALVARLRPAALVVPAGLLVVVLGDLLEPPAAQPVELAALAADDGDERALAAADERHERREVEARGRP